MPAGIDPIARGRISDVVLLRLLEAGVPLAGLAALLGVDEDSLAARAIRATEEGELLISPSPYWHKHAQTEIVLATRRTINADTQALGAYDTQGARRGLAVVAVTGVVTPPADFCLRINGSYAGPELVPLVRLGGIAQAGLYTCRFSILTPRIDIEAEEAAGKDVIYSATLWLEGAA